jgi:glutamate--cysteine ligase
MRFLDVFLLHCLLAESPPDTPDEIVVIKRNQHRVAARGREPGLKLGRGSQEVSLFEWGGQLLVECGPLAEALDAAHGDGGTAHRTALGAAVAALKDPDTVPSARVLQAMARDHGNSYVRFALALSHLTGCGCRPPDGAAHFARLADESLAEQRRIEAADTVAFETFRQRYLSAEQLKV